MPDSADLAAKIAELRGGFRAAGRGSTDSPASSTTSFSAASAHAEAAEAERVMRVVVRCRPPAEGAVGAAAAFTADPLGRDKVSVRVDAPQEVLEAAAVAEDAHRAYRCNAFFGPTATQQEIFADAAPIVEYVMKGGNGAVLCYGATGSGKSHTLIGPTDEDGVAQRVATMIFEYIRDRSSRSEVFAVDAAFLLMHTDAEGQEILVDLLSDSGADLEVTPDPGNTQAFVCDGLRRLPVRAPDEFCEALRAGRVRRAMLEERRQMSACHSHSVLALTVESLSDQPMSAAEPIVYRRKLLLVDLAGSEAQGAARQSAAIGRALVGLGGLPSCGGPATPREDSKLHLLLRDTFGGAARALFVATIAPEAAALGETLRTLRAAQQMASRCAQAPARGPSLPRLWGADRCSSAVLRMRNRQAECIRILQEKAMESQEEEQAERQRLQREMEDLNKRLLTKESAYETLERMRDEQLRRIDEMRAEMTETMSKELEKMREYSLQDLNSLRESVEQQVTHLSTAQLVKHTEEHTARMESLQVELLDARSGQKTAEDEAAELRLRLASVEERAKMLQARQDELRNERSTFEEERKELRQQSEQQWQKLMSAEQELQRKKAEVEVQKAELARLGSELERREEVSKQERDSWRSREAELQQEIRSLRGQIEDVKRDSELHVVRAVGEQKEVSAQLRSQVEQLEREAKSRQEQLAQTNEACAKLETAKEAALQREEQVRSQTSFEINRLQVEIEDAKEREMELMQMLNDIQDSIIKRSDVTPRSTQRLY